MRSSKGCWQTGNISEGSGLHQHRWSSSHDGKRDGTGCTFEREPPWPDIISLHHSSMRPVCQSGNGVFWGHDNDDETDQLFESNSIPTKPPGTRHSERPIPVDDLLLHNNVKWLSKGRVLECFWAIRLGIKTFLSEQKSDKATQYLEDEEKTKTVAFLTDITSLLNQLNVKLQGRDNTVCDMITAVRALQKKLAFQEWSLGKICPLPNLLI